METSDSIVPLNCAKDLGVKSVMYLKVKYVSCTERSELINVKISRILWRIEEEKIKPPLYVCSFLDYFGENQKKRKMKQEMFYIVVYSVSLFDAQSTQESN